jgi:hypothetical protein
MAFCDVCDSAGSIPRSARPRVSNSDARYTRYLDWRFVIRRVNPTLGSVVLG